MSNAVHWPSEVVNHFEDQHDIRIIAIRDFGSRAKNMDGPNSDIDAMFLFDQPAMAHKRLGDVVDTIDPSGEMYGVDLHGWNVRKFADLLTDSNPQAIEFLNSPIEYYTPYDGGARLDDAFMELTRYANRNLNPIRLYYHSQSFARKNYEKYHLRKLINTATDERLRIKQEYEEYYITEPMDGGHPRHIHKGNAEWRKTTTDRSIGRYLKALRAALLARHIRRTKSLPSMDFEAFLRHSVDAGISEAALDLLEAKRRGLGDTETTGPLNDLMEYEINYEPDNADLNRRGISRTRTNEFIETVDSVLFVG